MANYLENTYATFRCHNAILVYTAFQDAMEFKRCVLHEFLLKVVCVDAFRPSQHFFSNNQKISCLRFLNTKQMIKSHSK